MPQFTARFASDPFLCRSHPCEELGQLLVDLLALGDELLGSDNLLVYCHGSLRRLRFGAEIALDERALVIGENPMPIKILPLPYNLRMQNAPPPMGLRRFAIERDKVCALHRARRALALKREVVPAAPVAPVVPGAERVVHLRVTIDGPFRSAVRGDN